MPDCSYIDVIVPVMTRILDKQVQALDYAQEVHSMMTNIVLKGNGLRELLTSLTTLLQKPVAMANADYLELFFPIIAGDNFYGVLIVPGLEENWTNRKWWRL